MDKVCDLGNHVATFVSNSWGICGPIVCSWLSKVKAATPVRSSNDLGSTGSLILSQHLVMKNPDAVEGKRALFKKFGLTELIKTELMQSGQPAYSHRNFGAVLANPGLYYASIVMNSGGATAYHAIGVSSTQGSWQLCDPNFAIWETDDKGSFLQTLYAHVDYLDVVAATIFRLS